MVKAGKIIFILGVALLPLSCSKRVYTYADELGTSQFILYRKGYLYKERTPFSHFKVQGDYEVKDSSILFEYNGEAQIPYPYFANNLEILGSNIDSDFAKIKLIDATTRDPIPLALIHLKDSLHHITYATKTDFDGTAVIKKAEDVVYVEVEFIGYPVLEFSYKKLKTNDLVVKMEQPEPGGRLTGSCMIFYLDVLLAYGIDNPQNIQQLTRNRLTWEISTRYAPTRTPQRLPKRRRYGVGFKE